MTETFEDYLKEQNLSQNTIISYVYTLNQYNNRYCSLTRKNLRDYKIYLIENYKPQTVNLRIRAINCYLESIQKEKWKLTTVKVQQKPFLENVISEADYLYFKNRLKQDGEMYWYFVVRFLAATGDRACENRILGSLFQRRKTAQNLYPLQLKKRSSDMALRK